MIIGISGFIGSGKDTVADYLVNRHGFTRESWAGALKDAVAAVFGWDRQMLEGNTLESRIWREQSDKWWSERLGFKVTPRNVLQLWGTDVCRNNYHDQIWIASVENKLRNANRNIVISDCRFENELTSIKNMGGITVRIVRGKDPEWVEYFKKDRLTAKRMFPTIHASEYSSVGLNYDYIIENNSTLEDLYIKINDLVLNHQFSM